MQKKNPFSIFITTFLPLFVFFFFFSILTSASEQDLLLSFKSSISDPIDSLSSWTNSSHPCTWSGITCTNSSPPSVLSLNLQSLNLSGAISPSLCSLPSLAHLNLAGNLFNQPIPLHLSHCNSLTSLNLSTNLLWGPLPNQMPLSLTTLDLSYNHLQGQIPPSFASLQGLQVLNLAGNLFSGALPPSLLSNLTDLLVLDLSDNPSLVSGIPQQIGKLGNLQQLLLQRSGFHGGVPDSFVGLHGLEVLDLSQNNLTGNLPLRIGSGLGKLVSFDLSQNGLSGPFPADICLSKGLTSLSLHTNLFSGSVADSLERCLSLERFQVQNNGFSGDFPSGLWSLPKIKLIRAENNRFSGGIPNSVSMAVRLEQVQIDNNSFTGRIPPSLGSISSMYRFSASSNGFYGELPQNFCSSPVMSIINLSHNSLSGSIPELQKCRKLVSLSLADNSFIGKIPASLADLPVLTYIDLSNNNLTGEIPPGLQNLKLALFNVSFNRLSGRVPSSLISGLPASFLQGNPDLCGPGLPNSCADDKPKRRSTRPTGLICLLISIAFAAGIMVVGAGFFVMYRSSRQKFHLSHWKSVFFYPLRVTEQDLEMGMDEKNAVGSGAFGKVHVIRLPSGEFVAVKKLMNVGILSSKALKAEIKTLAKARHKNIVKLLGFCYSEDSILLIYEYIQKGSLGDLICRSDFLLEWRDRLRIAVGAAQGLAYLHKDYVPHLLHRNIKSKNILLDMDFEPKLTDFGLDHIVGESVFLSSMASELHSSIYMAPEHGCSKKATEQMDVYSFGVVLLELVTGRQAEEPESGDSINVVKWVRRKINMTNGAIQVLDSKISKTFHQEMLAALEIALRCTSVMPDKRPTMFEVVRSLQSLDSKNRPPRLFSYEFSAHDEHSDLSRT
ncbi:probably inactive leucine-rich repeat receptor-like protein kinase At5g06940 [Magnolia sinica]|uniref:probably inactive leucine-rich repeat receptor-like protein kinase At5g06940 n=1 Tax=Magnolia sinica TaxID=86752 RepID=UPI002658B924|nr:probably inactive leucine-rich repeat receptor-like protein kinase At5g06940 [Magnolia sinica]